MQALLQPPEALLLSALQARMLPSLPESAPAASQQLPYSQATASPDQAGADPHQPSTLIQRHPPATPGVSSCPCTSALQMHELERWLHCPPLTLELRGGQLTQSLCHQGTDLRFSVT